MPNDTVFTIEIETALHDQFLAEAAAANQPAAQILADLIRDFVVSQSKDRAYKSFVEEKVAKARESIARGLTRSHEDVEAEASAWRRRISAPPKI